MLGLREDVCLGFARAEKESVLVDKVSARGECTLLRGLRTCFLGLRRCLLG